jgi:hypothetical protein
MLDVGIRLCSISLSDAKARGAMKDVRLTCARIASFLLAAAAITISTLKLGRRGSVTFVTWRNAIDRQTTFFAKISSIAA